MTSERNSTMQVLEECPKELAVVVEIARATNYSFMLD
ncbi:hypothetical protein Golax_009783 [Gossypium laxum]|uniref:Uncharacterized protein n=1 Tax=Gossypium laxum TaxID=34288 RepID=A0A7J8ZFF8_9ROSI|nr:hypothetical protein [Gossypium laxum]